jgi:hypothetical protein
MKGDTPRKRRTIRRILFLIRRCLVNMNVVAPKRGGTEVILKAHLLTCSSVAVSVTNSEEVEAPRNLRVILSDARLLTTTCLAATHFREGGGPRQTLLFPNSNRKTLLSELCIMGPTQLSEDFNTASPPILSLCV